MSVLFTLLATTAIAADSPAERIGPYLTDTAVAVVRVDLQSLDREAAQKSLQPFVAAFGLDAKHLQQLGSRMEYVRDAGFQEIYIVIDLAQIKDGGTYVVMPIPEDIEPPKPGTSRYEAIIDDAFVFGNEEIIAHFKNNPTANKRASLAEAFKNVAESPIQIVVAPTASQRRILREMLPDLDGDFGNITGDELAAGLKWAAMGVAFEPELAVELTIQSNSEDSAEALRKAIAISLQKLSKNEDILAVLPMAPELVASLTPEQNGDRLTIDPEQAIKAGSEVFDALVRIARKGGHREQTTHNLKQLGLAMHNFHGTYKSFPPAASYSKDGQPLLSWRVFVLPYVEEGALYKQFHLDEPWNSDHNKKLIDNMPEVFKSPLTPTKPGMTVFQVPSGKGLIFEGKTGTPISKITDGTSNTIMVVETTAEKAVPWTKPDDLKVNLEKPLAGLAGDREGFWALFADGSVQFIASKIDPETLKALFTRAGGEVIGEY